jgi:hypothetical protein
MKYVRLGFDELMLITTSEEAARLPQSKAEFLNKTKITLFLLASMRPGNRAGSHPPDRPGDFAPH